MKAEALLALYERVADAPNAIPRLRRFVLDLAVRGRLVSQLAEECDPQERNLYANDRPFGVPPSWRWMRVGDQLNLLNGVAFKPSDWRESGVKIVRIQNLNNPSAPFNHCDPEVARERSLIDDGSFLISWSGTPGTSFGAFIWKRGPAVLNQHIFRCDFRTNLFVPEFLRLAVNGRLDEMIAKAQGGVGLQHITKGKLEALLVPLPPLGEQHRIVAKVDELMALLDRLEDARSAREATSDRLTIATLTRLTAPETDTQTLHIHTRFALDALPALTSRVDQIKQLRQTILSLAVRGKLDGQVSENRPFQTPSKSLPEIEGPFDIPSGWRWARLRDLGALKGGGTPSKARDDYWSGPIPWVSPKDMKVDAIHQAQLSISEAAVSATAVNLIPARSVLFVVRGMILAHSFPVAISSVELTINQDMKALVLKPSVTPEYMLMALKGLKPEMLAKVQRSTHGTCRIDGSDYADFPVPVPPLADQKHIVAKVDKLIAICDRLEAAVQTADTNRARLLEALLHGALASDSTDRKAA